MKTPVALLCILLCSCAGQPHVVHVVKDAKGAVDVTVTCPPDNSAILSALVQLLTFPFPL